MLCKINRRVLRIKEKGIEGEIAFPEIDAHSLVKNFYYRAAKRYIKKYKNAAKKRYVKADYKVFSSENREYAKILWIFKTAYSDKIYRKTFIHYWKTDQRPCVISKKKYLEKIKNADNLQTSAKGVDQR